MWLAANGIRSLSNYISMGPRVLTQTKNIHWVPVEERPKLRTALKALTKAFKKRPKRALPLTINMLHRIFQHVNVNNPYESATYIAMLLAFFGILRAANVTTKNSKSYDKKTDLSRKSLAHQDGIYGLKIRKSKTITHIERVHISWLPEMGYAAAICPTTNLLAHIRQHRDKANDAPLIQVNGKALTKYQFKKTYNILLGRAGICCRKRTPHALRRGGATFGADMGMGPRWLKGQGDWRSAAYKLYIKNSRMRKAKQAKKWSKRARQYILGK